MKRLLCVLLTLTIVFCIAFECTINSSAVVGIDDALLIGTICFDLAALGITIYGVQDFVKSDAFKDFCNDIGQRIDQKIELVKINGVLFYLTAKSAWDDLVNWVKSKFSGGKHETKQIEFETTEETHPTTLTLRDGTVVPWAEWMEKPFFIYKLNGNIRGINCSGGSPGMVWGTSLIQIWCTGRGQVNRYDFSGGNWTFSWTRDMNYGLNYKDTTGSFFNLEFSSNVGANTEEFYLYRTMQRTNSAGVPYEPAAPDEVPEVDENTTAVVTASSDPDFYPGAVDAPATVLGTGDAILIRVPEELVVDGDTDNPTLTLDIDTIGQTIADTTPADVRPVVGTEAITGSLTVDQIIAATPDNTISGTDSDIETANKFKLPRSFLEGFPFSIPYSIYAGLRSFVAEPQAPVFDLPFNIPALGLDDDIHVDLTDFNPVARLCRAFLSLVWVACLAIGCHKFIKR